MTYANDVFDRSVREWLHADAEHRVPDHLEAVLRLTSVQRQRPAWSSLERWLPMDMTLRPRFFQTPRLSQVLLVGAVILALVAALILYAGSQQHRLPPPFGVARNGALISSADGDIFTIEPSTGRRTPVVGGDTFDFGPNFSRDGTRFMFLRGAPSGCGKQDCGLMLMVANADGTGVRQLTPGLPALDWQDWSPDGKQIAFDSIDPRGTGHVLQVVNVDGSDLRTLPAGRPVHELSWLPPDGREIVFRGEQLSDTDQPPGIFAIRPDGTGLHELSTRPAMDANDYQTVAVSPDGSRVLYRDAEPDQPFHIRLLDLTIGTDMVLPQPSDTAQLAGLFSPDGRSVALLRVGSDNEVRIVVAPADGSDPGRAVGPPEPWVQGGEGINNWSWSPDGTAILANYDSDKTARLIPIDGSPAIELAHGDLALPGYQRLAP
jgi:Tol biopolymer transport system component